MRVELIPNKKYNAYKLYKYKMSLIYKAIINKSNHLYINNIIIFIKQGLITFII